MYSRDLTERDPYQRERARALALYDLRRWREVVVAIRRLLASQPNDDELIAHVAFALSSLCSHDDALVEIERALAIAPDHEWYHRLRSSILTALGRSIEALDAAREAVRCAPTGWQSHTRLVYAAGARGLFDEAMRASDAAIRTAPNQAAVWNASGYALGCGGDVAGALVAHRRALSIEPENDYAHAAIARLSEGEGAVASARIAVQLDPADAHNLRVYARALSKLGRHGEAIAAAEAAVNVEPDGSAHDALVQVQICAGRLDDARRTGEAAVIATPDDPHAWRALAEAAGAQGDVAAVRAAVAAGAALGPSNHQLFTTARRYLGDELAADIAADYLARDPDSSHWLQVVALMRARQGRFDEALVLARRSTVAASAHGWESVTDVAAAMGVAVALPMVLPAIGPVLLATIRGNAARAGRDWQAAAAHYRAALVIDPYCCARFGLAVCELERGDLDGAAALVGQAVERNPTCFGVARHLAERRLRAQAAREA